MFYLELFYGVHFGKLKFSVFRENEEVKIETDKRSEQPTTVNLYRSQRWELLRQR